MIRILRSRIASVLALAALGFPACSNASSDESDSVASPELQGALFVANKRGASLSRIDLETGEETHRAETCDNPHELTVPASGKFVIVACYSGRTLEVFHTADLSPAGSGSIELGDNARVHSAIWQDGDRIFAGAEGRGSFYIIALAANTNGPPPAVATLEIGGGGPGPHLIAVNSDETQAWGTIIPTGEVVRYDLSRQVEAARAKIGDQIEAIALAPDESALWVSSNSDSIAYRLNPMTLEVEAEVETGAIPIRLAMHPSGDFVVSSNLGDGNLSVIDTRSNRVVRTIEVSGSREAVQVTLVFSADGERLYAAETAANTIAEIDFASGKVLRRLATGEGGDGLAVLERSDTK